MKRTRKRLRLKLGVVVVVVVVSHRMGSTVHWGAFDRKWGTGETHKNARPTQKKSKDKGKMQRDGTDASNTLAGKKKETAMQERGGKKV